MTRRQRAAEATLPEPPAAGPAEAPLVRYRIHPASRRLFRRGPWENAATGLIALGAFMLMQPFSLWLFGWSFAVILAGTIAFVIVSHFPD